MFTITSKKGDHTELHTVSHNGVKFEFTTLEEALCFIKHIKRVEQIFDLKRRKTWGRDF